MPFNSDSDAFQLHPDRRRSSGWRKATILADCVVHLCAPRGHPAAVNGAQLIDDEYLRDIGATDEDLIEYRCDPAVEPPRLLAPGAEEGGHGASHLTLVPIRPRRRGERRSLRTLPSSLSADPSVSIPVLDAFQLRF
ncbi:uncharacterized protein MICPUCDRAFT_54663 [Micromonas pusilla CCMP1545]|jgi:hypothetical protein|uniref:Predicted protein n=1 Tax=Micromonas pusilla (strain CCMP1545) TaxID=564608 RepID=C1N9W2_MICPC|nr:uncharacterized protein MICPUCDRAFT_54663 [Micromonas pusilla CCMP1545]EEH51136.1 predicted protein [Micromonas pusilla CCMP1545]|eukprot:XP_003064802.1 predicted protein [Micromonas pusilla CCMP1545]